MTTEISREELYLRLWQTPASHLAKEFGILDRQLVKICIQYDIPRPGSEYRRKLLFNTQLQVAPLPITNDSIPLIRIESTLPIKRLPPHIDRKLKFERLHGNRIKVPSKLLQLHSLVVRVQQALRVVESSSLHGSLIRSDECPGIRVSRKVLGRALLLLHAIVCSCEARGMKFTIGRTGCQDSCGIELDEHRINFRLVELVRERAAQLTHAQVVENLKTPHFPMYSEIEEYTDGTLSIEIWNDTTATRERWIDIGVHRLERSLNAIMSALHVTFFNLTTYEDRRAVERNVETDTEERRFRAERAAKDEMERRTSLAGEVAAWRLAFDIREYLAMVAVRLPDAEADSKLANWMTWAAAYADELDPLPRRAPNSISCPHTLANIEVRPKSQPVAPA